ncbi:MAG: hypothetical protein KY429_09905 [Actinobacteria bacterium]|nr:hypothetical protein [Actinomycetota bacterium]
MDEPPLSVLLSKTLDTFSRDLDAARADGVPPLAVWANVLQHLNEDGVDQRDLPRLARLSKRALPPVLKPLERAGHIAIESKRIRLTPLGRAASELWPGLQVDAERRWRRRFGAARMNSLRRPLELLVSQFDLLHPDFPTQYGPSDPRINGGPGQDWKPVPRAAVTTTTRQSLTSLLSQALVEVAMEYDGRAGPLQFAANVLRFVPDKGIAVSELPDTRWLGTMVHHRFATLSRDAQTVKLTANSKKLRDAYLPTLVAIEKEWWKRYGKELVDELRGTLDAIVVSVDPKDELPHLMSLSMLWSGAKWSVANA